MWRRVNVEAQSSTAKSTAKPTDRGGLRWSLADHRHPIELAGGAVRAVMDLSRRTLDQETLGRRTALIPGSLRMMRSPPWTLGADDQPCVRVASGHARTSLPASSQEHGDGGVVVEQDVGA